MPGTQIGRDGQQRQTDDRDQQRFRRRGLSATERRRAGRAICIDRGERYRFRNAAGGPGEGVRSVLHDQATGAGHRPRIEPGLRLRQAIRRRDQDIQRGRAGNDNQDLPAPRRRRSRDRRTGRCARGRQFGERDRPGGRGRMRCEVLSGRDAKGSELPGSRGGERRRPRWRCSTPIRSGSICC